MKKAIILTAIMVLAVAMAAGAVSADSGRYNLSKPAIVEITNPVVSCYKSQASSTANAPGCHMINWSSQDIGAQLFVTDNAFGNMPHPGQDRSPAAMYPGLVHNIHGNANWPQWDPSHSDANSYYALFTSPQASNPLVSGNNDASIGSGTAYGFYRDLEQMDCPGNLRRNYQVALNGWITEAWGNPQGPGNAGGCALQNNARYDYKLEGCSAQGVNNFGCHGISDADRGVMPVSTPRQDSPNCSQCHFTIGNVTSSNSKHGTAAGAGGTVGCADCHDPNAAGPDQLSSTFIPEVKQCWQCHSGTKIGPTINTTGMHAGKDCRFCHGHGHNITRDYTWNRTCGNLDSTCHGAGAPAPRNIGGDASFAHGSAGVNVTCGDCHIPSSSTQGAHNITIPSCGKCHNTTGIGNASVGSSSRYGASGDNRPNIVPNWDRGNNIYHDGQRGDVGGLNCTFCHIPGVAPTAANANKIHYINTTQNGGQNYVPDCQSAACHGNPTTPPTGKGTWINYTHGQDALAGTGFELTCTDCHNNATLRFWNNDTLNGEYNYTRTINTSIHRTATSPYNITPYNSSRVSPGTNDGTVSYTVCLNCHNATQFVNAGDCAGCHTGSNGVLEIHDANMSVGDTLVLDGVMAGGCDTCHSSRSDGIPDNTKSYTDAGGPDPGLAPPLHNEANYSNRMHSWHVDNASAECTNCHPSTSSPSMPNGTVDVSPATGSTFTKGSANVTVSFNYTLNNNTYTPADNSTCTNIACHYLNLASQNRNTTAVFEWKAGGEQAQNCNSCHLYPPTSGKHSEHMNSLRTVNGTSPSCTWCHGADALSDNHTGHRDGVATVSLISGGTYTPVGGGEGYCNGECHAGTSNVYWAPDEDLTCRSCHNANQKAPNPGWNVAESFIDFSVFEATTAVHGDLDNDTFYGTDNDCRACHYGANKQAMTGATNFVATYGSNTRSCYDCHT